MMQKSELDSLKYRELQKLAKEAGVKANLPRAQLVEALMKTGEEAEVKVTPGKRFVEFVSEEEEPPSQCTPKASTPKEKSATPRVSSAKKTPSGRPSSAKRPPKSSLRGPNAPRRQDSLRAHFADTPASAHKNKRFAKTPHSLKSCPKTDKSSLIPKFKPVPDFAKLHAKQVL